MPSVSLSVPPIHRLGDSRINAFMESCFGTVKRELELECYENERVARGEIRGYIRYYNTRRRHSLSTHSSFGYLTPEEFENRSPAIR